MIEVSTYYGNTKDFREFVKRVSMDCKETQHCIQLFLKDELDDGAAQKFEGMSRLENADDIDVQKELEEMLNRTMARVRRKKQLKAGLFLLISLLLCMLFLGGT